MGDPAASIPRSPAGTAGERTALAWARSGLATAAIAGSLLKTGLTAGHPLVAVASAGVLLALGAGLWTAGGRAYARHLDPAADPRAHRRTLALAAAVPMLSAAIALAMILAT